MIQFFCSFLSSTWLFWFYTEYYRIVEVIRWNGAEINWNNSISAVNIKRNAVNVGWQMAERSELKEWLQNTWKNFVVVSIHLDQWKERIWLTPKSLFFVVNLTRVILEIKCRAGLQRKEIFLSSSLSCSANKKWITQMGNNWVKTFKKRA